MSKFKNNKSNKNQGIHTIFGQHSVKAALQNDKREHIELIISKNHINFAKKYESKINKDINISNLVTEKSNEKKKN